MSKTILIIDDEPGILKILRKILEQSGYVVLAAASGNEGFDTLKSKVNEIDFVICDVKMPNGSGTDFLSKIKENLIKKPVLLVSGFADLTTNEALEKGAIGIMSKPYDFDIILELIESHTSVKNS